MSETPFAEAAARNAAPILEVLRREFHDCREILEIGSGTGQHAVIFAGELPQLDWRTSDLEENHAGIKAWIAASGLENVHAPLSLDVRRTDLEIDDVDGVFSCNTAHIMSVDAVGSMFALVGKTLRPGGVFCLYGPFRVGGRFNTDSNARFDMSLRSRHPQMGIRDLESLDAIGVRHGLHRFALYAMPSNNFLASWRKGMGRMQ